MNNFKKIGLTALAGSLVTLGATAGEMSVSGSINTVLKFGKGGGNTSKSIGADRDFTVSGGGELDNGTTFSMSTTTNDALGLSASTTTITTPSLGSFMIGAGTGGLSGAYDEEVPTAYEQVSDGKDTASNKVGDFMDNNHISYTSPTFDMMGATITGHLEYSPQASDTTVGDGGSVAYSSTIGAGAGAGVTIGYEGLKIGVYGAERDRTLPETAGATGNYQTDEFNGVWYAKYTAGPVSIGYSEFYLDAGVTSAVVTSNAAATRRTGGGLYSGEQMSVAFNVNDSLSISYTTSDETYDNQDDAATAVTTDDDVTESIDAIQVAYSMGGMSIKAYSTERTNNHYDSNADDLKTNEIAIGLAF